MLAIAAMAIVVGIAAWSKGREPGADIRNYKTTVFAKSQARLCPFDAPALPDCETP